MSPRSLSALLAVASVIVYSRGMAAPVSPAVADVAPLAPLSGARVDGILGARLHTNLHGRLLRVPEAELLAGFVHPPGKQEWIGEHIGKYFHAATNAWLYTRDPALKAQLDRMVAALIATQKPDGYLGTYQDKDRWTSWDVWVHKYNLIGLLAYHQATGDARALAAAQKIGELLERTFGPGPAQASIVRHGTHVGMAATSVLEPMVLLHRATGDARHLAFARYIVDAYDHPDGPAILSTLLRTGSVYETANAKAYELLSNLIGLVELYRTTGEAPYLKAAVTAWHDVRDKRLYISGTASSKERFQKDHVLPAEPRDDIGEGCVTVTWLQLTSHLFRLTGSVEYAHEIERTVWNQLLAAQDAGTGDISYYTPLGGQKAFNPGITCCGSSEPRGISMIPQLVWSALPSGPAVLLYTPSTVQLPTDAGPVALEQKTDFPQSGAVSVVVSPQAPRAFALSLRVPPWTKRFTARVGGKTWSGTPGQMLVLQRTWRPGDRVDVQMDMTVRVLDGAPSYAGHVALARGPQVLALERRLQRDELDPQTVAPKQITAAAVHLGDGRALLPKTWITTQAFTLPGVTANEAGVVRATPLLFVPFADARKDFRVWLSRPDTLVAHMRARTDAAKAEEKAAANRPKASAQRVSSPLVIDGKLDEAAWRIDGKALRSVARDTENTLSFGAAWDYQFLYVGARVTDSVLKPGLVEIWDSDGVEVYVDGDRSMHGYDAHDVRLLKGWNTKTLKQARGKTPNAKHAWAPSAGGYTIELALPWKELGVVPRPGLIVGFDISNSDNDKGFRAGRLFWAGDEDDGGETSHFGDLELAPAASAALDRR